MCVFFFFFKQKTAYEMRISDWSSDVCSSDLVFGATLAILVRRLVAVARFEVLGGAAAGRLLALGHGGSSWVVFAQTARAVRMARHKPGHPSAGAINSDDRRSGFAPPIGPLDSQTHPRTARCPKPTDQR